MPSINCLTCGYHQSERVSAKIVGKKIKCPQCHRAVTVQADQSKEPIDFPVDEEQVPPVAKGNVKPIHERTKANVFRPATVSQTQNVSSDNGKSFSVAPEATELVNRLKLENERLAEQLAAQQDKCEAAFADNRRMRDSISQTRSPETAGPFARHSIPRDSHAAILDFAGTWKVCDLTGWLLIAAGCMAMGTYLLMNVMMSQESVEAIARLVGSVFYVGYFTFGLALIGFSLVAGSRAYESLNRQ